MPKAQGTASALAEGPGPSARSIAIRVVPEAQRALPDRHPGPFTGSIREQCHAGARGDLGIVFDRKGRFLAVGLYGAPFVDSRARVQHGGPCLLVTNAPEERRTLGLTRSSCPGQCSAPFCAG
ncbi:MAG: hypothetical protein KGY78_10415 [Anaerolineae bacterium]|nr:hypothetical protein [Anaerolineae bacterium]